MWLSGCSFVGAAIFLPITSQSAPSLAFNEYETKAAAFYNVLAFTNWPSEAFSSPDAPLVIAVAGHGRIASLLDKIVAGETWRNRKIVVEHYESARQVKFCHVLFIAQSEQGNWPKTRALYTNRPVLTVSDAANFATLGGNVQLAIEQNHLRILVNLSTTGANGLQLSSNLLRLATIIGPIPNPPQSGTRLSPLDGTAVCLALIR
jgi:hypothetical protein